MEKSLPIITIAGIAFYVDVVREQFREYGHDENVISFNHLQGAGDHYTLAIDKRTKNICTANPQCACRDHIMTVPIPAIVKLDPVGLAEKLGKPVAAFLEMKDDTEW